MMQFTKKAAALSAAVAISLGAHAEEKTFDSLPSFFQNSSVSGSVNLRFESVEDQAASGSGSGLSSGGLTARTAVLVKSPTWKGLSTVVEVEDVRDVLGVDDPNNLIPDAEVTEIDQAFIQYKNSLVTAKVGRQVIIHDRARFIGNVGWRQDHQTFDAARVILKPADKLNIDLTYVTQRNRIFPEQVSPQGEVDSNDVFLNVSYGLPFGKVVGYYYGLDDETDGLAFPESDTVGAYIAGKKANFIWHAEFATQSIDLDDGQSFNADFRTIELGGKVGKVVFLVGQEVLGSDDGQASFTTPLATLHKFNGWSDVTLGGVFNPVALPNGLQDNYISVTANFSGWKLLARFHQFNEDAGDNEIGDELELLAVKKLVGGWTAAGKFASFRDDADDTSGLGDFDRNIFWAWVNFKF